MLDTACKSGPIDVVFFAYELFGVTVQMSTLKGCDKFFALSGRFLTLKFDVTDCVSRPPLQRKPQERMLVDCPTDEATPTDVLSFRSLQSEVEQMT